MLSFFLIRALTLTSSSEKKYITTIMKHFEVKMFDGYNNIKLLLSMKFELTNNGIQDWNSPYSRTF